MSARHERAARSREQPDQARRVRFRRFAQYRLRVLLYAGRPNWDIIDTIDPAQIR
ncbi:MAG: hypothetical protein ACRDQD_13655 [Nocardioidaceae bacterium]